MQGKKSLRNGFMETVRRAVLITPMVLLDVNGS
jgi:hypothetical protein